VYRRILVPMENEEHQGAALAHAQRLASSICAPQSEQEGTPATVILAWLVPVVATEEYFLKQMQIEPGSRGARRKAQGQAFLERASGELREAGADVETVLAITPLAPEQAILNLATEHEADLILMATLPQSAVGRFLLGSVGEKVRRRSPLPVLFVQAPEAAAGTR
jgi:nucleotide-binding universal stress UspA family protein